jgi:ribosomal protein S16
MKGRENQRLTIRLLRQSTQKTVYHIVVSRIRTDGNSRLDSLGKLVLINGTNSYLKLDMNLLNYYLYKNISFSKSFAKVIGMDEIMRLNYKHKNENNSQKTTTTNTANRASN